jgi:apolipoprotein N-acyltransferase
MTIDNCRLKHLRPRLPAHGTLLSALLLTIAFPPLNIYLVSFFALVPWFFALSKLNTTQRIVQGAWLSFLTGCLIFYWIINGLHTTLELNWTPSILYALVFFVFHQPQFIVFGIIFGVIYSRLNYVGYWRPILFIFSLALLYTGVDWVMPKIFDGSIGHVFYSANYIRQIADFGGVHCISFLAVLINLTIFVFLLKPTKKNIALVAPAFIFLIATLLYGYYRVKQLSEIESNALYNLKVAAIQPNIDNKINFAAINGHRIANDSIIQTLEKMSDETVSKYPDLDLSIWPEAVYPRVYGVLQTPQELAYDQRFDRFLARLGHPLVYGNYEVDTKFHLIFNALTVAYPNKSRVGYHKNILMPFGEYVPGEETFSGLKNIFKYHFSRGPGPRVITIINKDKSTVISPIICYEAVNMSYVMQTRRLGAQLIVNLTDDSSFGTSNAPEMHLMATVFSSIATRLPQIRATNSGISAIILPSGEIRARTDFSTQDVLIAQVPITSPINAPMLAYGDWFGRACLVLSIILLVITLLGIPAKANANLPFSD